MELNDKYDTHDAVGWRSFLKHPSVRSYIKDFLDEQAEKHADNQLAAGVTKASDALKVRKVMDEKAPDNDNHKYIIFLMPQKRYIDEG